MTTALPHRFRVEAFRRYEKTLAAVINGWPEIVVVDPTPYSVETYRARFRDAMHSYDHYNWPTTAAINRLAFEEIKHDICVAIRGNEIHIGPRAAIRASREEMPGPSRSNLERDKKISDPCNEVILAYATLLHYRHETAVSFVFTSSNHPGIAFVKGLEARYDVAVEETQPNTFRVI